MVKQTKAYDNESITSLKGADRVRKRPSVIFGSDGLEGAKHTFFEVLSNSIDEAREGYGREITVIRHGDRSISVIDKARGIPVEYNKAEGRYNWELIFCELYAGGKYNNISGETYEYSLGLNGLGLCATQYSSEYMDVEIVRDGHLYALHFEKGENVGGLYKELTKQKQTGSTIKWRPDLDVFTDIAIPSEYFEEVLKRQAIVNKGLRFIYQDEESNTTREYIYDNGIVDYLDEIAEDKRFTQIKHYSDEGVGRDRPDKPEYKVKVEMAFCFNNEVNVIEYYHNSSYLEHGGSPDKAVKSAFTAEIDQYIKKQNKYQKNEKKISFVDVQDSLVLVVNSFSTMTSYENQTKKAVTNKFIQDFMTEFIRKKLEVYLIENAEDAERIIDQILINKRSREKAESTRLNLKKALSSKTDLMSRVKKFVDCRTKDLDRREIYIVEGDSALGACKLARDSEFQALMPIRGKILNCLKADYDKIFKSEIIIDLIRVLGCGVEIKSKHAKEFDTFNLDSLNWDKVVICTDADVDGFQIRTLVLSMIYALMPTLIHEGKVFIAETPLYEITAGKKTLFAYSDKEKTELLQSIKGTYSLQRSKGLGENDPEMMWLTTMSPDTRRLIRVEPEEIERTERMFEVLLGDDLEGRKEFIEQYGYAYLDQLDLS